MEPVEQTISLHAEKTSLDQALTWVVQQVDRLGINGESSAPVIICIDSELVVDLEDRELVLWCASVSAPYLGVVP